MSKHILITGASKGIGNETAKYLANQNCSITAIARSEDKLNQLRAYAPEQIFPLSLDITQDGAAYQIKEHLENHQLAIDGLIHNAGLLINKPFLEQSDKDWERQISVNLMAPVRLTRSLISMFNKNSHIVNISSMGGFQGSEKFPGLSAYSTVKGALAILTECMALELADYNIKANCLCLGAVQTEMLETAFPGIEAPVNPAEMARYIGDFTIKADTFINGKILPIALNNPE
ncbi:MAG: SDR family oxidoreductase [Balneolaceae bacterium]|nr:SDR family oxidoreductase [Balneolaceae bacterium]